MTKSVNSYLAERVPYSAKVTTTRMPIEGTEQDKLEIIRTLTEGLASLGVPLGEDSGPGKLALRHDPRLTVQRPHLQVIDDALVGALGDPTARILITTPPQIGKSTRVSRWFPFWWLTMRPQDQVIIASYASSLATRHGAATRDLVRMYGHQYGLKLQDAQNTRAHWAVTAGGSMKSVGWRTGASGFSMDLGIIDDPLADRQDADNPESRNKLWDWYSSVWTARRAPTTREVLVMTRWHQDDLAGRLLKQDGRVEDGGEWTVVHIPAIALVEDHAKGIYADPLGREPGEPVTHPKIPTEDIVALRAHWDRQRKATTARDWTALYQGTPVAAEGALLTENNIRDSTLTAPALDEFTRIAVAVDPSGGGRDTAGIVVLGLDDEGDAWVLADFTERMTSPVWSAKVCTVAHTYGATRVVVESNYGGDQATTLISQAWELLEQRGEVEGLCPLVTAVTARVNKVLRAEPIAQAVLTDRVYFAAGANLGTLTAEWIQWEPGSTWSPGALDASVHGITHLLPKIARGAQAINPADQRRDQPSAAASGPGTHRINRSA